MGEKLQSAARYHFFFSRTVWWAQPPRAWHRHDVDDVPGARGLRAPRASTSRSLASLGARASLAVSGCYSYMPHYFTV